MMTFITAVVALVVSAASPPAVEQGRHSFRRYGFVPEPGARIGKALPEPLTTVDVEYWISTLELDQEAAEALRAAVNGFYESRTPEISKIVEPVDQATAELARRAGFDIMRLPDAPEALLELQRLQAWVAIRLNAIEEELFAHVARAVSPDTPEAVSEVIRQLRRHTRNLYETKLPMAQVNLRFIEAALRKEGAFEILDKEAWLASRPAYDSELATLHERRLRLHLDLVVEDLKFFRDSGYDLKALVEYRTKQSRRQLSVERSIIAANRRWAEVFAEMMSPDDSDRWRYAVRAATYPTLHPNPVDVRRLAQAVQTMEASGSGAELKAVKETLLAEIARLASMESAVELEFVAVAVSDSRGVVNRSLGMGLEESISRLRKERCESAVRAVELCKATPEAKDLPEIQILISAILTHCGDVRADESATSPQGAASADQTPNPNR